MALFRLCRMLHMPHPDVLRRVLTARQIDDWFSYEAAEQAAASGRRTTTQNHPPGSLFGRLRGALRSMQPRR